MQTPLEQIHLDLGARMTDFAGWNMPLRYGSAVDEHHAVRSVAGIFDLSHMSEIDVSGPDAAAMIDYSVIGQFSTAAVGQARYTMICDDEGHVLDDLVIYRRGEDRFLVVANASNGPVVVAALKERAKDFDVEVNDHSLTTALIAIQGPKSEDIVAELTGDPGIRDIKYYRGHESQIPALALPVFVARTGYTGEDGFEIYVPMDKAVEVWTQAMAVGEPYGMVPAGLAARDTLRLEAGMALYGHELNNTLTPFDAGAGRLIKFDKDGDFVGKEALAAAQDRDHHRLIGLEVSGKRPAREDYVVLDASTGEAIGVLTSGTLSPTLDKLIAIARINPGVGDDVAYAVDVRGTATDATEVPLPFYKRER